MWWSATMLDPKLLRTPALQRFTELEMLVNQTFIVLAYRTEASGGVDFCSLASGQHSSEQTSQRWRLCF